MLSSSRPLCQTEQLLLGQALYAGRAQQAYPTAGHHAAGGPAVLVVERSWFQSSSLDAALQDLSIILCAPMGT